MAIRKYRPTSAGRRAGSVSTCEELTVRGNSPEKSLIVRQRKTGGRNHHGKITSRHRGGGHKQMYRLIDFRRGPAPMDALVSRVEYDPCRSAHIALLVNEAGRKSYIIAPEGVKAGIRRTISSISQCAGRSPETFALRSRRF